MGGAEQETVGQLVARHGLHVFAVEASCARQLARREPGVPLDEVQVCHVDSDEFVHLKRVMQRYSKTVSNTVDRNVVGWTDICDKK